MNYHVHFGSSWSEDGDLGPECDDDIRTVNGVVHPTYKVAYQAMSILGGDDEWHQAIREAAIWQIGHQLHELFVSILLHYGVTDPLELWERKWELLSDDILFSQRRPYSLYPRGNVIQDPKVAKVFDVTPIPYHSHESGGFSHPVFHPIPGPSINACTDEVRKIASSVSPYVVNICFLKGNRVLGKGSGTIIDSGGIILTSVHLLGSERNDEAFKGSRVDIAIDRGQGNIVLSVPGVVWYADSLHGIAIIKIDCSFPLQAAKLGSVQQLCPHDVVFFAGRTRTFASQSHAQYVATEGLYIRGQGTDGGPIFNLNGEVVGVMTRKESSNSHAICIDVVSNALDYFRKHARRCSLLECLITYKADTQ
ncbi:hypothetical protein RJ639_009749 [Escallonia herrerae]|uniref:Serine protease n=1 Tax=Escallonia herrerae TaxID=1293975 RepID=A0AA88VTT4_9ASTE|nr:hypothetical protein RJ639_009749 [Escallonia herrerae]